MLGNPLDLQRGHPHLFVGGIVGFGDCRDDLIEIKGLLCAVSFDNLHIETSLGINNIS